MNVTKIAAALRLLADAIEPPAAPATAETAPAASAATPAAKRGPGRPPKTDAAQTAASAAPSATSPASTASASQTAPTVTASPASPSGALTHAVVANDFKAAAAKHGRDFVVGLMKAHNAPTFDKVPVVALADFQAALKAGPQAASGPADDLLG